MARTMPPQRPGRSEQAVGTPPEFILAVCRILNISAFAWDLAATRDVNQCAPFCFTKDDDAFKNTWVFNGWGWLNPEFADIAPWVQKAYESVALGGRTAVLVPASIGARWWIEWVQGKAAILPLDGRITFVGQTDPYPKDCALLIYADDFEPGYASAVRWMDLLTSEEKQMAKRRIAKPAKAAKKKEPRSKIRPFKAAKPAKADKKKDAPRLAPGRVTTFKANAPTSVQPAPEPESLDLGPILLPDPDDAVKVLGELARLNDRALQAKASYDDLKERAKNAKDKYDDLAEQVLTRLQVTTHKSDLPLFSEVEREADQKRMETAASAPPANDEPPAAPESLSGSDVASEVAGSIVGEVGEAIQDEEIPF